MRRGLKVLLYSFELSLHFVGRRLLVLATRTRREKENVLFIIIFAATNTSEDDSKKTPGLKQNKKEKRNNKNQDIPIVYPFARYKKDKSVVFSSSTSLTRCSLLHLLYSSCSSYILCPFRPRTLPHPPPPPSPPLTPSPNYITLVLPVPIFLFTPPHNFLPPPPHPSKSLDQQIFRVLPAPPLLPTTTSWSGGVGYVCSGDFCCFRGYRKKKRHKTREK